MAGNILTPVEKRHIAVMSAVAKKLNDTPLILKGGTALLLGYGLDRFSEDLDFDSPKPLHLENRIASAIKWPVKMKALDVLKDTDTVTRYRLAYETPERSENRLKIEISYRNAHPTEACCINSIQIYKLSALISQKLSALEHRTQARDLYDVCYLASRFWPFFNEAQIQHLEKEVLTNLNALENRFALAFEEDEILSSQDVSSIVLNLQNAFEDYHEKKNSLSQLKLDIPQELRYPLYGYIELQSKYPEQKYWQMMAPIHQYAQSLVKNPLFLEWSQPRHTGKAFVGKQGGFDALQTQFEKGELTNHDIDALISNIQTYANLASQKLSQKQAKSGGIRR